MTCHIETFPPQLTTVLVVPYYKLMLLLLILLLFPTHGTCHLFLSTMQSHWVCPLFHICLHFTPIIHGAIECEPELEGHICSSAIGIANILPAVITYATAYFDLQRCIHFSFSQWWQKQQSCNRAATGLPHPATPCLTLTIGPIFVPWTLPVFQVWNPSQIFWVISFPGGTDCHKRKSWWITT